MSENSKTFDIVERNTEHTQRVVFEEKASAQFQLQDFDDDDDDEVMCSFCTQYVHEDIGRAPKRASNIFHEDIGRAPKRASNILCDDIGRAPKRASDILCDTKLSSSSHPTTKDTQEKTRKGETQELHRKLQPKCHRSKLRKLRKLSFSFSFRCRCRCHWQHWSDDGAYTDSLVQRRQHTSVGV